MSFACDPSSRTADRCSSRRYVGAATQVVYHGISRLPMVA